MASLLVHPLLLAFETESPEKINHWLIGGLALFILSSLMLALLAFGRGRDHS